MGFIISLSLALWGFPDGSDGKESATQNTRVQVMVYEGPLEEEIATRSSILAWEIP